MSVCNGGRPEDSKGLWENRRRVGWINPFPVFGAVAQPFHLFYSRLVNFQSLTVIVLGVCVCVCACISVPGEKWDAKTPTLKMLRSWKQNGEAMRLRQKRTPHFALCSLWNTAWPAETSKAYRLAHDTGDHQNAITQPRENIKVCKVKTLTYLC